MYEKIGSLLTFILLWWLFFPWMRLGMQKAKDFVHETDQADFDKCFAYSLQQVFVAQDSTFSRDSFDFTALTLVLFFVISLFAGILWPLLLAAGLIYTVLLIWRQRVRDGKNGLDKAFADFKLWSERVSVVVDPLNAGRKPHKEDLPSKNNRPSNDGDRAPFFVQLPHSNHTSGIIIDVNEIFACMINDEKETEIWLRRTTENHTVDLSFIGLKQLLEIIHGREIKTPEQIFKGKMNSRNNTVCSETDIQDALAKRRD